MAWLSQCFFNIWHFVLMVAQKNVSKEVGNDISKFKACKHWTKGCHCILCLAAQQTQLPNKHERQHQSIKTLLQHQHHHNTSINCIHIDIININSINIHTINNINSNNCLSSFNSNSTSSINIINNIEGINISNRNVNINSSSINVSININGISTNIIEASASALTAWVEWGL